MPALAPATMRPWPTRHRSSRACPRRPNPRRAAVLEVLSAYLALVEELDLCPWARPARRAGELRVSIELLDEHPGAGMAELVHRLAGTAAAWRRDPGMRVGLALVPDLALSPAGWRQVRDAVGARAREFVLADFHTRGRVPRGHRRAAGGASAPRARSAAAAGAPTPT
jgi:hypothetical protein